MALSKEDYVQWRENPITVRVFEIVEKEIDELIAVASSGELLGDSAEKTAMGLAKNNGIIRGLSFLREMEMFVDE